MSKTSMSKTGITKTSMSKTGITKTNMSKTGRTKGKVGSCGFSNLWGNLDWLRCNTGVNWGNKGLWVEGGGNTGIDWSNGQTRVSNAESSCISDILNLLKLTIGINIRISTSDSTISVS